MADITYCERKKCDNKKCERHHSKIAKACINGIGYVSVSDYADRCGEYFSHSTPEHKEEKKKCSTRQMK